MARKVLIYAKNLSEHPQQIRHRLLKNQTAILIAPSGFVEVKNSSFVLPGGAIAQIPALVWQIGGGVGKRTWSKEVFREDFLAALDRTGWLPEAEKPNVVVDEQIDNGTDSTLDEPKPLKPQKARK